MRRYIQLYSGSRDRQKFPNQSAFDSPFSNSQQVKTPITAVDPILNGPIYYTFNFIPTVITGTFQPSSRQSAPILDPLQTPGGLNPVDNYYTGWAIIDANTGALRVIKTYSASTGVITMDTLFPRAYTGSGQYVLFYNYNPTYIYIPQIDLSGNKVLTYEQAYLNYYVVFETPNINYSHADHSNIFYRKIVSYDNVFRIAYFDKPLPEDYNPFTGIQLYTLRKTLPLERWTVAAPTVSNIITLPVTASPIDNYYVGKYVYYSSNVNQQTSAAAVFSPVYGFYYITSYNGTTKELTVNSDINSNPLPSENNVINITTLFSDNYSPYTYSGTMVSENQATCYEVSLDNLTIPNVILKTGSRIAFYSFLYVKFINLTSPTSALEPINSNNPPSKNAIFVAPITQSTQPSLGTYMTLRSDMKQTITFKPNDGFRFAIFLPDGSPFQTLEDDTSAPYPPNLFLQINATFSFFKKA